MKKEYGSNQPDGIKEIHSYDFIEWDRKTIVETIKKEMGWEKPKEAATSWRIDCDLVPLVNYLTEKVYGVSKFQLGFSNMIRSKNMTREEALNQLKDINNNSKISQLKLLLREMEISNKWINKLLLDK